MDNTMESYQRELLECARYGEPDDLRQVIDTVPLYVSLYSLSPFFLSSLSIEQLLEAGVDVNWADERGNTAMHMCVQYLPYSS